MDFIKQHVGPISKKQLDQLNENDAIEYAYATLCLDMLASTLGVNLDAGFPDKDKEQKLNDLKRVGILKGIEFLDFYTFEHTGDSEKNGRKYLTRVISVNGVPHIFLITVNPEFFPLDEEGHNSVLKKLGMSFEKVFNNVLELEYNSNSHQEG